MAYSGRAAVTFTSESVVAPGCSFTVPSAVLLVTLKGIINVLYPMAEIRSSKSPCGTLAISKYPFTSLMPPRTMLLSAALSMAMLTNGTASPDTLSCNVPITLNTSPSLTVFFCRTCCAFSAACCCCHCFRIRSRSLIDGLLPRLPGGGPAGLPPPKLPPGWAVASDVINKKKIKAAARMVLP